MPGAMREENRTATRGSRRARSALAGYVRPVETSIVRSPRYGVTGQVRGRPGGVRLAYSAGRLRRDSSARSPGQSRRVGVGGVTGGSFRVGADGGRVRAGA